MTHPHKIGLATCVLREPVNERVLSLFRKYGFDFLELSVVPEEKEVQEYQVLLPDTGMRLWAIHSLATLEINIGASNSENRKKMIENIHHCIDIAVALRGRVVVVHPGTQKSRPDGGEGQNARARESLSEVISHARDCGITLCLENMLSGYFGDMPGDMRALLAELPEDCVGACIDTGHGNEAGNLFPMLDAFGARLFTTHLNDNLGLSGADPHLIPGDGNINWQKAVETLRTGYANPCIFELLPHPQDNLDKILLNIKSWCERLEVTCA